MKSGLSFLLVVLSFCVRGQSDSSYYRYGVSGEFRVDTAKLIISPALQIHTSRNVILFGGPSYILSLDNNDRYDKTGYCGGLKCFFSKLRTKKADFFVELESSHIAYKYNTSAYDTASPNIPVKATLIHQHKETEVRTEFGLNIYFLKRLYVSGAFGIKGMWQSFTDPGTADFMYNQTYEGISPTEFRMRFAGNLKMGILF